MDIAVNWNTAALRGDWKIAQGGFAVDAGLHTAVLVSLFTDRVASPDYVPPAGSPQDRRGWWGDTYSRRPIGSRLWQLYRSKKSDAPSLPNVAQDYCLEALKWLIDDGIAATVAVRTGWIGARADVMAIEIAIARPSGITVPFAFEWVWQGA